MIRKYLALLLALALSLTLAACGDSAAAIPGSQDGTGDFQKNMHQAQGFGCWLTDICETDSGFYFNYGRLYFLEKGTNRATIVCGKPDCDHTTGSCNACISSESLWHYGDKLYFIADDFEIVNEKRVEHGRKVFSVNMDCTGRKAVQDLDFEAGGDTTFVVSQPVFHRGNVYFVYCDTLYRVPLGADVDEAQVVWAPEPQEEQTMFGYPVLSGNEPSYKLWGDGDLMYFMVNAPQPDGSYRDTLFSHDPESGETSELWVIPTAEEVGPWEFGDSGDSGIIGASATLDQWYILEGYVYFFLSMNGLWRYGLETGEYEKLSDTTEKAEYGTALFDDERMWLLNDGPASLNGRLSVGSPIRVGGDTVFVYGLDGELQKELSLKPLTDEVAVSGYFLLFASGDELYLMADAGTVEDSAPIEQDGYVVSGTQKTPRNILCSLNMETGSITRIAEFDH